MRIFLLNAPSGNREKSKTEHGTTQAPIGYQQRNQGAVKPVVVTGVHMQVFRSVCFLKGNLVAATAAQSPSTNGQRLKLTF